MEWFFDNLKLLVFIIIIVAYVLKAMKAAKSGEGGEEPGQATQAHDEEAAEAERTRQIQEEIRRRILARQRGESSGPVVIEPEQDDEVVVLPPPLPAPVARQANLEAERAAHDAAILEAQRALEEQLRLARQMRAVATAGIPSIGARSAASAPAQLAGSLRRALRADLAGRRSLRRAVLLREVLGDPVALRPAALPRR